MNVDFTSLLDSKIIIVLWCLGYGLKHIKWKPIKSISNTLIPVFLTGVGVIMACFLAGDVTLNAIIVGFVSAMFAIGVHASGKNIFKAFTNSTVYVTPDSLNNSTAKQVGTQNQAPSFDASVSDYNITDDGLDDGVVIGDDEVIIDDGSGSAVG